MCALSTRTTADTIVTQVAISSSPHVDTLALVTAERRRFACPMLVVMLVT